MQNPGFDGFNWFLGIVDAIDDPLQLGRVKVRLLDNFDESVDIEDIPWASVLTSPTSASFLGIGRAPVGMVTGTRVIGFFLDGEERSKPVILGTLPFINQGNQDEHSVSAEARGERPVQKDYLGYEPETAYKAQYPFNGTINTRSGHVIEIDDTPKAERIHIFHKSGAYIEMFPDGRIVTKSPADNVEISIGDKNLISDEGAINISAKANCDVVSVDGAGSLVAKQDVGVLSLEGSTLLGAKQNVEIEAETTIINSDTQIKKDLDVEGKSDFQDDITIDGDVDIKGDVNITGSLKVNGRPVQLK